MEQSKLHKTLNIVFRLFIVAFSLGFLYWKLIANGNIAGLYAQLSSFGNNINFFYGIAWISLFMFINWSLETLKWQSLIRQVEQVKFFKAFYAVLAGVTVSIFTPNRTGEFIGRVFTLKADEPGKAVMLTIVGSLSQLLITILSGTIAFAISFRKFLPSGIHIPTWAYMGMVTGIIILDGCLLLGFFNVRIISNTVNRIIPARYRHIHGYLNVVSGLNRRQLSLILSLSFLRYLVFSFQFYLILRIFGLNISLNDIIFIIPVIYLILAVTPTIALSEIGIRGSVSLVIIGTYLSGIRGTLLNETESLAIVLAAGVLWIINLAVPAILGIPFVFKLRFFRK